MGMFDKEVQLTKAVQDGTVPRTFRITRAEYMGRVDSAEYGPNDKARVMIEINGVERDFVVFGVMAQQIQRMAPGDLPAWATIGKDGRANVFERAERPEETTQF